MLSVEFVDLSWCTYGLMTAITEELRKVNDNCFGSHVCT